ncbi:uncharacterized protein LOC125841578 [Solanum stenotomum]|uniref:uncharacterized protein LOC125841578 n=1 Tax=Solanum stenotomum TaxID=172797 RepID=UPI0020D15C8D|nr:uncharacterized protein LOC125841578 [Solanum stenotomum]
MVIPMPFSQPPLQWDFFCLVWTYLKSMVRRLAMEVRQLASARSITVLNGSSSGNWTSLVMPAAAAGALGYGYMWWKGLSFSDLMYVTKKNMATAVSNLTKHLDNVSEALAATKRHLTQRIENVDGKLDEQMEMSKLIRSEVNDVHGDLSQIGFDLDQLNRMVSGLDGKLLSLEGKQELANAGVMYLCNFINGKKVKMPETLQVRTIVSSRTTYNCGQLYTYSDGTSANLNISCRVTVHCPSTRAYAVVHISCHFISLSEYQEPL